MIAEDVQRRIWLIGLIGALILGALFMIWAVFLNRGTIIMHAKAPYNLTVEGIKTENCMTDECKVVVAPGDYNITVQKAGYKPQTKSISVPLGHPYQDNITLEFIPVLNISAAIKDQIFPPKVNLSKEQRAALGISGNTPVFFDNDRKIICYLLRNPDNFRQTLYTAAFDSNGNVGKPQIVTSFLRDLQSYVISPSSAGDKVAIIDQASDQATLYMIDLQAKNRASLLIYPMIREMRWIPRTNDFLFVARERNETSESVFLYRWVDGKTTKLNLKTPLDNIAIVDSNRLLAITNQSLPDGSTPSELEGKLVPLGENQSTAEVSAQISGLQGDSTHTKTPTLVYPIVDYSLIANQARLLSIINTGIFPTQVKADAEGKSLYFLQGDSVSQLRFEE